MTGIRLARDFLSVNQVLFLIVYKTSYSDSAVDKLHEKNLLKELKLEVIAMKVFSSVGLTEINSSIHLFFLLTVNSVKKVYWEWKGKIRILWRPHYTFPSSVIIHTTATYSL